MNIKLQIVESNFTSELSASCELIIQFGEKNIRYAVIEGQNQLKALFDAEADLNDLETLLSDDPLLRFNYQKVKIGVNTSKFTFIPQEVYTDLDMKQYAAFIQPSSAADLLIDDIRSFHIKNLVAVDNKMQALLKVHFPKAEIFSNTTSFIEGCRKMTNDTGESQLFLNFNSERFEAAVIKDNQLHFYNTFEYQVADEFNYFLLLIIQQFELNAANTDVFVSGEIKSDDSLYQRIEKYFDRIAVPEMNLLVAQQTSFETVPLQQYFSLLSLKLCE